MFHSIVEGPHDPCGHPCSFHPVHEGANVLPLLADCYIFQAEEDLINTKVEDILVNKVNKPMNVMVRHATYLIFKGHAWC